MDMMASTVRLTFTRHRHKGTLNNLKEKINVMLQHVQDDHKCLCNRVEGTKYETCAILHRFHIWYISCALLSVHFESSA